MTLNTAETPANTAADILNPGTELTDPKPGPVTPNPEVQKPPPERKDLTSSRFAALSKKETALVRDRAAIKLEREEIEKLRAETQKLLNAQKLAMENPDEAFKLLGWDYNKLTEYQLKDKTIPQDMQTKSLREELKAELKRELDARDKEREEALKTDRETKAAQTIVQFKEEASEYLKTNKEKFPLINHPKNDLEYSVETISAIIEQHFHATATKNEDGAIIKAGKLMSVLEASELYENHLKDLALSFSETLKPKSDAADPNEPVLTTREKQVQEPRTITNSMASTTASQLPPKTEADRMARAMAALSR